MMRAVDLDALVAIAWCFPTDRGPIQDGTKIIKNVMAQRGGAETAPGGEDASGSLLLPLLRW